MQSALRRIVLSALMIVPALSQGSTCPDPERGVLELLIKKNEFLSEQEMKQVAQCLHAANSAYLEILSNITPSSYKGFDGEAAAFIELSSRAITDSLNQVNVLLQSIQERQHQNLLQWLAVSSHMAFAVHHMSSLSDAMRLENVLDTWYQLSIPRVIDNIATPLAIRGYLESSTD